MQFDNIYQGDSEQKLKEVDDGSADLVVTDPPYGYGFMGKDWDRALPSVNIWRECYRILKDGAFMFVMSSPRQDVEARMIVNLQDAGFETGFTSIYWAYASGFPKACNISKMVDKRLGAEREVVGKGKSGNPESHKSSYQMSIQENNTFGGEYNITIPSTPEAKALDGSYGGFQPKPAVEVVLVVMKPLSEKTFVDQALKNGHGVTWLDNCKIPTAEDLSVNYQSIRKSDDIMGERVGRFGFRQGKDSQCEPPQTQGRFPANLLVSDDVLNDGVERKSPSGYVNRKPKNGQTFNVDSCGFDNTQNHDSGHGDSGSFSRYFDLDQWWDERIKLLPESVQKTFPFLIVPKASKAEKNKGCEGLPITNNCGDRENYKGANANQYRPDGSERKPVLTRNHHPTVKPLKLFSYLITLGSREGDLVVDPFVGSGTSCVAAKALGRHWIGIDNEAEYVEIANKRIEAETAQMELSLAGG